MLPDAQWHVTNHENPTDASRSMAPDQPPQYTLWWGDPSWLTYDVEPSDAGVKVEDREFSETRTKSHA